MDELVGIALAAVGTVLAAMFAYGKTGLDRRLGRHRKEDLVKQVEARVREAAERVEPKVEPPGAYPLDAAERAAIEYVRREHGKPLPADLAPGDAHPAG